MNRIKILLITLNLFFLASSEDNGLSYKPFDELIYSVCEKGVHGGETGAEYPLLIKMREYDFENENFEVYKGRISLDIYAYPPKDITGSNFELSSKGNKYFWDNMQKMHIPFFGHIFFYTFFEYEFMFPFFQNELTEGDTSHLRINGPPLVYSQDIKTLGKLTKKLDELKQMYVGDEMVDGFQCARIEYSINDRVDLLNGDSLVFKLSGIAHFAKEEGVLVSDTRECVQDMLSEKNEKIQMKQFRKVQLLDYKAYSPPREEN